MQSGVLVLLLLLIGGMAAQVKGGVDAKSLLKGESFFVCKVNCGPMKAQVLRANIHSHGGSVCNSLDHNASVVIFDKSCEENPEKMREVRSSLSSAKDDVKLVSSRWLEEVVAKKEWKEPATFNKTESPEAGAGEGAGRDAGNRDGEGGSPPHKRDLMALDDAPGENAGNGKKMRPNTQDAKHPGIDSKTELRERTDGVQEIDSASNLDPSAPLPPVPKYKPNSSRPPPPVSGDFRSALQRIVANPDRHTDVTLMRTKSAIVIYDAFPKATNHLLVLPTANILSVSKLSREHLPILRELHRVGLHVAASLRSEGAEGFRMGYHCVPSLNHLHLHVISVDFRSPCLKNKKHWNSFQPPFFVDSLAVQEEVERSGEFRVEAAEAEEKLKAPLRCHRADAGEFKNMPQLKQHIEACKLPVASGKIY